MTFMGKRRTQNIQWERSRRAEASQRVILAVKSTSSMDELQNVDIDCSEALKEDSTVRVTCLCSSVTGQKCTTPEMQSLYEGIH